MGWTTSVSPGDIGSWGFAIRFCPWLSDFNLLPCFFTEEQPVLPSSPVQLPSALQPWALTALCNSACDWGELLNLQVVVYRPPTSSLGETTAGLSGDGVAGLAGSPGAGFSAFQNGLQVSLGNSLNLRDICSVPRKLESVSPEATTGSRPLPPSSGGCQ